MKEMEHMDDPSALPVESIRVLIVDDHAVVRQGLRTFLQLQDDPAGPPIAIVGEAADGVQAVEMARRTQPDVVLLDLVMPGLDGIAATPQILACSPHSRVLILTSFGEEDKIFPAIRAGAHGYLLKDIPPNDLALAVRAAQAGQVQLHPDIARKLMSAVASHAQAPPRGAQATRGDDLSARERDVLRLVARGLNNHEIAACLVISEKTVKTHVSSILSKLSLADRTQAAIWALKHELAE